MGVVIDSSVFITFERLGREFDPVEIGLAGEMVAIAAMTASELFVGVHLANSQRRGDDRLTRIEALLRQFPILAFDLDVARLHARLWSQLSVTGNRIGDRDLIIGATALAHGYSVVTENVRDFDRIPGLTVIDPNW